jgi:ADP-ribosyl-[dinitrogen reductase] hydrolase
MAQLIRTSRTHPIRIDTVATNPGWGLISMSFCPGKKQFNGLTGSWSRDLYLDLARIRDWGASIVVSLIEAQEFASLDVEALPDVVAELGMQWRHGPIPDRHPPHQQFMLDWPTLKDELMEELSSGKNIFIHCMGGLGRTGVVAAMLLMEVGYSANQAIAAVRTSRPHTIETSAQEDFVRNYVPQG